MGFVPFRHKSNGRVEYYPAHYADDPILGADLELYFPEEWEEDKVVDENHSLPVEQRINTVAVVPADEDDDDSEIEWDINTADDKDDK